MARSSGFDGLRANGADRIHKYHRAGLHAASRNRPVAEPRARRLGGWKRGILRNAMDTNAKPHVVEAATPGEAWFQQMSLVLGQGVPIQDDGVELIELTNLLCIVQRPWVVDPLVVRFGDKSMLEFMRGNFHDTEPIPGWGYSYGQRIFDYDGFDQLERVVGLLREKPEAKSATITLGRPGGDSGHQPCINVLDFKLRGGLLQIGCFFRSQDVGKKLFADVISLGEIGQMVAARVGCRPGPLVQVSCSSHIYGEDVERVKQLLASAGFGENG